MVNPLRDDDFLRKKYVDERLSPEQIALANEIPGLITRTLINFKDLIYLVNNLGSQSGQQTQIPEVL